ncbi:hypothetical protein JHFBIEKO_3545 [Methylobacterium mesophilicum]|uniref:hypothetical protein n=1 Tax=Methylobacterium mesophilicum TaxID=39956 RepID=UPI001EE2F7F9|nr:hypothetical protein [Methylobacterium mesophilicum]GJE23084.1 hypothetical protein JHFBIEKO_3545 [Methylobacterium mesophilicum]
MTEGGRKPPVRFGERLPQKWTGSKPDTYPHFYAEVEMYTNNMTQADSAIWLLQYVFWEVATKENNLWIGVEA